MKKEQKKTKFLFCKRCKCETILMRCPYCKTILKEFDLKKYGNKIADKADKQ